MEELSASDVSVSLEGHKNQCERRIKELDRVILLVNIILGKSGTNMPLSETLKELDRSCDAYGLALYKFYNLNHFVKKLEELKQKTRKDYIDTKNVIAYRKTQISGRTAKSDVC